MPPTSARARRRALARPVRFDALGVTIGDRGVDRVLRFGSASGGCPPKQRCVPDLADRIAIEDHVVTALTLAREIPRPFDLRLRHHRRVRFVPTHRHRPHRRSRNHGHHPTTAVFVRCCLFQSTLSTLSTLPAPPPVVIESLSLFPDHRPCQHHQPHHRDPHYRTTPFL